MIKKLVSFVLAMVMVLGIYIPAEAHSYYPAGAADLEYPIELLGGKTYKNSNAQIYKGSELFEEDVTFEVNFYLKKEFHILNPCFSISSKKLNIRIEGYNRIEPKENKNKDYNYGLTAEIYDVSDLNGNQLDYKVGGVQSMNLTLEDDYYLYEYAVFIYVYEKDSDEYTAYSITTNSISSEYPTQLDIICSDSCNNAADEYQIESSLQENTEETASYYYEDLIAGEGFNSSQITLYKGDDLPYDNDSTLEYLFNIDTDTNNLFSSFNFSSKKLNLKISGTNTYNNTFVINDKDYGELLEADFNNVTITDLEGNNVDYKVEPRLFYGVRSLNKQFYSYYAELYFYITEEGSSESVKYKVESQLINQQYPISDNCSEYTSTDIANTSAVASNDIT